MENGAFAHNEQMLHFPQCFQIYLKFVFSFLLDDQPIHHKLSFRMNESKKCIGAQFNRCTGKPQYKTSVVQAVVQGGKPFFAAFFFLNFPSVRES